MKFNFAQFASRYFLFEMLIIFGVSPQVYGQTAVIVQFPPVLCQNSSFTVEGSLSGLINTKSYSYEWLVNTNNGDSSLYNNQITNPNPSQQTVTYTIDTLGLNWNQKTIKLHIFDNSDSTLQSTSSMTISLTLLPGPIMISDPATICPGSNVTLTATNQGVGTINWYSNQSQDSIAIGNTFTVGSVSENRTYHARAENACGESGWVSVTISVYQAPDSITNITKDPDDTLCEGESITLEADGITGQDEEVQWYDDSGLTNSLGTGDNITLTFSQTTTVYAIRVNTGCQSESDIKDIEIEVAPPPVSIILSPDATVVPDTLTVCVGDSLIFYPDRSQTEDSASFEWSKNGNVSLTNIDQDGVVAVFNTTGQRRVILTVDESLSCKGLDTVVVTVFPQPDPDINISDRDICSGESVTFLISPEDDVSYSWAYAGQSSSATSVNFTFTDPVSPIVVTASNEACSVQASDTVRVTPSPIANIGANGGDQTCVGIPIDLFAETSLNSQDVSYDWAAGSGIPPSGSGDSLSVAYDVEGQFEVILTATEGECEARDTFPLSAISSPMLSLNGVQLMDSISILEIVEMSSTPIMLSSNLTGAEINWELSLDSGSVSNNFQETGTGNISEVWELKSGVDEAKIRARITVGLIGCSNSYEVIIIIRKALFIPDIISPNGDGFNDTWNIELLQAGATLDDYSIELHHRQGQCIYGCSSVMTLEEAVVRDWSELADGPYFYLILGPDDFMMSGPVTLVR